MLWALLLCQESVSTCRFAQRCGMLQFTVTANEGKDLHMLAKSLSKQVKLLKQQLAKARRGLFRFMCSLRAPVVVLMRLVPRLTHMLVDVVVLGGRATAKNSGVA